MVKILKDKVIGMEQAKRANNLVIAGIPKQPDQKNRRGSEKGF